MLAHLIKAVLAGKDWRAYECVGIAWRVAASLPGLIPGPKELAAARALFAVEPFVREEVQSIFILGEHVEARYKDRNSKRLSQAQAITEKKA
jgi:hypothetical protein